MKIWNDHGTTKLGTAPARMTRSLPKDRTPDSSAMEHPECRSHRYHTQRLKNSRILICREQIPVSSINNSYSRRICHSRTNTNLWDLLSMAWTERMKMKLRNDSLSSLRCLARNLKMMTSTKTCRYLTIHQWLMKETSVPMKNPSQVITEPPQLHLDKISSTLWSRSQHRNRILDTCIRIRWLWKLTMTSITVASYTKEML